MTIDEAATVVKTMIREELKEMNVEATDDLVELIWYGVRTNGGLRKVIKEEVTASDTQRRSRG